MRTGTVPRHDITTMTNRNTGNDKLRGRGCYRRREFHLHAFPGYTRTRLYCFRRYNSRATLIVRLLGALPSATRAAATRVSATALATEPAAAAAAAAATPGLLGALGLFALLLDSSVVRVSHGLAAPGVGALWAGAVGAATSRGASSVSTTGSSGTLTRVKATGAGPRNTGRRPPVDCSELLRNGGVVRDIGERHGDSVDIGAASEVGSLKATEL